MLSLITINMNNYEGLRRTLDSIKNQTIGTLFQHIIIDGGSSDGSLDLILQYARENSSVVWTSEKDRGIYDAMNKGLSMATSEYVAYLNSGDELYDANTLHKLLNIVQKKSDVDIFYSDLTFKNDKGEITREWISGSFSKVKIFLGWMMPHPLTVIRREIILQHSGFNLDFKISADYDLLLRILLRDDVRVVYFPEFTVRMETGGVSNSSVRQVIKANSEVLHSWRSLNGFLIPYWIFFIKPLSKFRQLKIFK